MKELETLKLYRGATSVIELDFTGFKFENNGYCQLTIQKKYNDDIIFQHDFNKSIKYYATFKDEFTSGLDDDKYKYDIMYMLNEERYPQCSISDIIIDEVVNDYKGEFDKNAVQVTEVLADGAEITQSIKVTTSNVIIVSSNLQEKTVIPTKEEQVILAEDGFDGMSKVVVEAIPSDYVIPTLQDKTIEVKPLENKNITADEGFNGLGVVNVIGTIDTETKEVTPTKEVQTITRSDNKYIESVTVNAIPDNYIEPSGEMEITENGNYDVTEKASIKVDVSQSAMEINDASYLFYNDARINEYETYVSMFKNITNINSIFDSCDFTQIDVSNIETSKVTNMSRAFYMCSNLTTIDLSNWNFEEVTTMAEMFSFDRGLKSFALTNKNVSKLTNIMNMFSSCENITSIDLSNWNLESLQNISGVFQSCKKLETLNLDNWDMSSVTNVGSNLFANCTNLTNFTFGVNLGKGYNRKTANYSAYTLTLSASNVLTHDSLMSVINNLYDLNLTYNVANGGTLYRQQLVLGETNLAKLTEDEIAIATNKGWTVS